MLKREILRKFECEITDVEDRSEPRGGGLEEDVRRSSSFTSYTFRDVRKNYYIRNGRRSLVRREVSGFSDA